MSKRSTPAMPSVVPPSRLFVAPSSPFDTEVAVLGAASVTRDDPAMPGVLWIASPDLPEVPLFAMVQAGGAHTSGADESLATHLLSTFRRGVVPGPAERSIVVASSTQADAMAVELLAAGLQRSDDTFFGIDAATLAEEDVEGGAPLTLEPMVGDEPWRDWGLVERAILDERFPGMVNDALLDRTVEFKRRQQRHSPPIRRFLGRDPQGAPIAMIGYAPFATCDLGFARPGVLARLRDVAVIPRARRRGVARGLLRALAARAIDECGATQVLIGAASAGAPLALYRSVGAKPIGTFVTFRGDL